MARVLGRLPIRGKAKAKAVVFLLQPKGGSQISGFCTSKILSKENASFAEGTQPRRAAALKIANSSTCVPSLAVTASHASANIQLTFTGTTQTDYGTSARRRMTQMSARAGAMGQSLQLRRWSRLIFPSRPVYQCCSRNAPVKQHCFANLCLVKALKPVISTLGPDPL